jgi:putative DNA primase/helicase
MNNTGIQFSLLNPGFLSASRRFEPLIKQIIGNDALTARFLYGEFFDFVPTFKVFMATNHKPMIKGTDYGIWRHIS